MKNSFKILLILSVVLLILSCNTTEPPQPEKTIKLELEDTASIEAWIKITTNNIQLPATVTLNKSAEGGNAVAQDIILSTADSVVYIDSLLPKTTYTFQASIHTNIQTYKSNELSVTTMDTTSHNFTWQSWTFGEHSSSVLFDVAVIDENNIWAVGEIYMNDSLGNPDPHAYNAVHWDGQEWKLYRIMFYTICGQSHKTPYPAKSIFAFNKTDIWIAMDGDQIARLNDTTQTNIMCLPFSFVINKLWGSSANDMYAVGNNGNIARWNGTRWIKLFNNGTDLNFYDILGAKNKDDEFTIYTIAANISSSFDKMILNINSLNPVNTDGIPYSIHGIWFKNKVFYVVGSGMYKKYNITSSLEWEAIHHGITNYYLSSINGNDLNDIAACGAFGELLHFNGYNWKSYQNIFNGTALGKVTIKNNLVVAVGFNSSKAFITIGRR